MGGYGMENLMMVFEHVDIFALVFLRIMGFMVIMPLFSGQQMPMMTKAGFALCFSILTVISGNLQTPAMASDFWGYALVITGEFFTGVIIGFVVYMMFTITFFMGQLIDYQIGFSMVSVMDPLSQTQAPVTGNLYFFVFLAFFVASGGFSMILLTVHNTYMSIPPGQAFIIGNTGLMMYIAHMGQTYLTLGFQFAMPVIASILVVDVALGVLVKASPQANVFVVGMPIKVGMGLLILFLLTDVMESFMFMPFSEHLMENINSVIEGLTP